MQMSWSDHYDCSFHILQGFVSNTPSGSKMSVRRLHFTIAGISMAQAAKIQKMEAFDLPRLYLRLLVDTEVEVGDLKNCDVSLS